jgi:lysophospholipase
MGPGSWGWVERAYASMRGLFAPGILERVTAPMLIVAAEQDRLVSFAAIEEASRRLPHATLVRFGPEARHELLRESDPVRNRAMDAIGRFLDTHAPPAT